MPSKINICHSATKACAAWTIALKDGSNDFAIASKAVKLRYVKGFERLISQASALLPKVARTGK